MAKTVVVNKVTTPTSAPITHSTANSYVVTPAGDLVLLDTSNNVVATYTKGTWGTARSGG